MADPTRQPYRRVAGEYRMNLPAGTTCGDCALFARCIPFSGHIKADEVCDFSPSRFTVPVAVLQRLDVLMTRMREDDVVPSYQDLLDVRGGAA